MEAILVPGLHSELKDKIIYSQAWQTLNSVAKGGKYLLVEASQFYKVLRYPGLLQRNPVLKSKIQANKKGKGTAHSKCLFKLQAARVHREIPSRRTWASLNCLTKIQVTDQHQPLSSPMLIQSRLY